MSESQLSSKRTGRPKKKGLPFWAVRRSKSAHYSSTKTKSTKTHRLQMKDWRNQRKIDCQDSVIKNLRFELKEKDEQIQDRDEQIGELREILGSHFDEKQIEELLKKDTCYDNVQIMNNMQWDLVLNYYLLQNIPINSIGST